MAITRLTAALALAMSALALAQSPLPDLKVEPIGGGSIFIITNTGSQPLTAYYIELAGYPGSSYVLIQDDIQSPIAAGAEKRLRTENMTAGAAPDYMKLQAAIFADGSSSGDPAKVTQIVEHRRVMLKTTREAIQHLEKAKGMPKADAIADFKKWAESMPDPVRKNRYRPEGVNQFDAKAFLAGIPAQLETGSIESVLASLESSEKAMAASKPAL